MNWLFDGFVSWIAKNVSGVIDAISTTFSNAVGCDLTTFNQVFPFASTAYDIMLGIGLSLLFLIFIFQIFRALWGPVADNTVDNPVTLIIRTVAFFPLVFFGKTIVDYVLYLASVPYTLLKNISVTANTETLSGKIQSAMNAAGTGINVADTVVSSLLLIIFVVLIGWNYIKLLIEIVERYIVVGFIAYTAPVAIATGASKATGNIFKGWCRLVGSQTFLMITNIWILKLVDSGISSLGSTYKGLFIVWALLIVAAEKGGQHFDSYLKGIVGNVAITGNDILDDMVAVGGAIKSCGMFSKSSGAGGSSGFSPSFTAGTAGAVAGALGQKFSASSFAADSVANGGKRQSFGGSIAKSPAFAIANAIPTAGAAITRKASGAAFNRSLNSGSGNFATSVISRVAHGNGGKDYGFIQNGSTSALGSKSFAHYFNAGNYDTGQLSSATIGNGTASATQGNNLTVRYFDTQKFQAPAAGTYTVEKAADSSQWYKQVYNSESGEKSPSEPKRL